MTDLRIEIHDKEVRRSIKALLREGPKAIAPALNRTAFEILEAEEAESRSAFDFASPSTERFLSKAFFFDKATPQKLRVIVKVKPGSHDILKRQVFGGAAKAGDPEVGPALKGKVAVPVNVERTTRGRIRETQLPGRLIRRNARGRSKAFISGNAIVQRAGTGLRVLYALVDKIRLKPRHTFFSTAANTARREFPKKAHRVLEKINLRRGR